MVNRRVNGYETSNFFSDSIAQCKKSMDNSPEERSQQLTKLGVPNLPGINLDNQSNFFSSLNLRNGSNTQA